MRSAQERLAAEQITITANVDFIDYNPKLSDGMRIVVPVAEDKANPSRNHYTVDGMYYVTEDGYVLSASDDADVNNGIRVESSMKKTEKVKEKEIEQKFNLSSFTYFNYSKIYTFACLLPN